MGSACLRSGPLAGLGECASSCPRRSSCRSRSTLPSRPPGSRALQEESRQLGVKGYEGIKHKSNLNASTVKLRYSFLQTFVTSRKEESISFIVRVVWQQSSLWLYLRLRASALIASSKGRHHCSLETLVFHRILVKYSDIYQFLCGIRIVIRSKNFSSLKLLLLRISNSMLCHSLYRLSQHWTRLGVAT